MSFQPLGRLNPVSDLSRDAHHSPATCFKQASFVNPWPSDLSPLWPKNLSNATYRPPHHPDDKKLEEELPKGKTMAGEEHPICRADSWDGELADDAGVRAVWLGHASFLVSFPTDGSSRTNVLFDPVFEDRCSPTQGAGPVRDHAPPCKISELPPIDLVVISHNHYDHLSADSIVELTKHHPSPHFVVPLGLGAWFTETGVPASRVQEMDWWEETLFLAGAASSPSKAATAGGAAEGGLSGAAAEGALRIACTPCQHGSGRAGWDKGSSLWASWCIGLVGGKRSDDGSSDVSTLDGADIAKQAWEDMRYKVFFAGDTAYRQFERKDSKYTCPAFKEIAQTISPSFDLLLLPIAPGSSLPYIASMVPYPFSGMAKYLSDEVINLGVLTSTGHLTPGDAAEIFEILGGKGKGKDGGMSGLAVGIHWGTWGGPALASLARRWLWSELRTKGIPKDGGRGAFELWDIGYWHNLEDLQS